MVPEEAEEEGESIIRPARAIDDFNKNSVGVVFVFLNDGKSNNQSQGGADVEECVILRSIDCLIGGITAVMRESHAVLRVFNRPWNKMTPVNTATVWLFVGAYAKSVDIDAAANIISAKILDLQNKAAIVPHAKSVEAVVAA